MSNDSKPLMSESIPPSNHESHYYEDKGIVLCDDIIKKIGDIWLEERHKPCEKAKEYFGQCVMGELLWFVHRMDHEICDRPWLPRPVDWWSKKLYHDMFGDYGDYGYKWIYHEFKDDRNICRQADGKVIQGTTWKGWVLKHTSEKWHTLDDFTMRTCAVSYTKDFNIFWWQDGTPGYTNDIETASPFDWCECGQGYNTKTNKVIYVDHIECEEQRKQSHWCLSDIVINDHIEPQHRNGWGGILSQE